MSWSREKETCGTRALGVERDGLCGGNRGDGECSYSGTRK